MSKDEVFYRICNAVLKLEVEKGNLNWRLSDVSREADVTRSLIYYYFGKEKEIILEEAYKFMLDVIFDVDDKNSGLPFNERTNIAIKTVMEMPYVFVLFFLEKNRDTKISRMIKDTEEKHLRRLSKEFKDASPEAIKRMYLVQLGAVVYGG